MICNECRKDKEELQGSEDGITICVECDSKE